MSGLCGLIDFGGRPIAPEALAAMADAAAYRGPDGIRHRVAGAAGFAHLALASTPEAVGELQPLTSPDGAVLLVADARLDNRRELIELLDVEDSAGDGELLLAAYLRWGSSCPERLLGDFAFAVWDATRRELLCACDALGVKPLHYAQCGSLLCFGSEAQQVLRHPAVPGRLDELSLGLYLCGELHLEPGRTLFDSVRRLPAAHRLVASPRGVRIERYWDVDPEKRTVYRRDEDYADHVADLLRRVVSDRLRASGEVVGVAMSGGLDSTSVAALAQQALGTNGAPRVLALSFAFDRLRDCDERRYTDVMAQELGLEMDYIPAEQHWALGDPEIWRPGLESPLMGWDGCWAELCRRLRARGARVVMTGTGGDEMFGGVLVLDRIWRRWWLGEAARILRRARRRGSSVPATLYRYWISRLLPAWADRGLRSVLGKSSPPPAVPAWLSPSFVRRSGLGEWFERQTAPSRPSASPRGLRQIVRHPGAYWTDRTAARFGLEARHPFLDRRLAEFLLSIPLTRLIDVDVYKRLLRRAMAGTLPDAVRLRPDKSQLGSFMDFSLREKEAAQVESLMRSPVAAELGLVDGEKLRNAFRQYRDGPPDADNRRLWYALTVELWLRHHHDFLELGVRRVAEATGGRLGLGAYSGIFADREGQPA